jgi:hypothetical protein
MIKIPAITIVPVLAILLSSVVLTFFLILPILTWMQDFVDFYEPALNETTPTIHIKDGHIELEGHVPQQITLADGAIIFFDSTIVDTLFDSAPVRSVFIAEQEMRYKTKSGVDTLSFANIKVDDDETILDPLQVREKLFQYRDKIFTIISIIAVLCVAFVVYIVVNFAAGIGFMVDAFMSGPHTFKQMLNLSSILLLLFIFIGIIFQIDSFRSIKFLILIYLVLTGVLVYVNTILTKKIENPAELMK